MWRFFYVFVTYYDTLANLNQGSANPLTSKERSPILKVRTPKRIKPGVIAKFGFSIYSPLEVFIGWFRETRFGRKFLDILYETAILVCYLGTIAIIHKVENKWVGAVLFFGKMKIEYIIDVGHLLAFGLFFLEIIKDIAEVLKGIINVFKEPENLNE